MKKQTILILLVIGLLALALTVSLWTFLPLSSAYAQNGKQSTSSYLMINSAPAVGAKQTDAITVALSQAHAVGLESEPKAIRVTKGIYKNFSYPGESDSAYDSKMVWVVWLKTNPFHVVLPGSPDRMVTSLYIFIDARNGRPFEFHYGTQSSGKNVNPNLNVSTWQQVSTKDIGKFPVPEFNEANSLIPVNVDPKAQPESTETP